MSQRSKKPSSSGAVDAQASAGPATVASAAAPAVDSGTAGSSTSVSSLSTLTKPPPPARPARVAVPVTLSDAVWEFALGTMVGIGFWHIALPLVQGYEHASSWVMQYPSLRWPVPFAATALYLFMVWYHLNVRLPDALKAKRVASGEGEANAPPPPTDLLGRLNAALAAAMPRLPSAFPWIAPKTVNLWLARWNSFLTYLSFIMMVGLAQPMIHFFQEGGRPFPVVCEDRWWGHSQTMLSIWVFVYSKFFELIDTAFHVIKNHDISFLHWFHHFSVLLYTYYCTASKFSTGAIFACVNSAIHGLMYNYYWHTSVGHTCTYGRVVTSVQLIQMFVGLISTGLWAFFHFMDPTTCEGPSVSAMSILGASVLIYGSYALLFARFFYQRWVKPSSNRAKTE